MYLLAALIGLAGAVVEIAVANQHDPGRAAISGHRPVVQGACGAVASPTLARAWQPMTIRRMQCGIPVRT